MTVLISQRRAGPFATNGILDEFSFSFFIPTEDALKVILVDGDGDQFEKAIDTDYIIEGVGVEAGGKVVFNTPPDAGFDVYLIGATPLSQPSDYKNQSSFQGKKHERSFDRLTIQLQELNEKALKSDDLITLDYNAQGRDIKNVGAAYTEELFIGGVNVVPAGLSISLPSIEPEKLVVGNVAGTGYEVKNVGELDIGKVKNSVAELKAINSQRVRRVFITGYYAAGDGGGGHYYYDASDTTSADNGGTIIVANDGARWKLIGSPTVRTFGAKGNGTDIDYAAFASAVAWYEAFGGDVPVPYGVYKLGTNTLTLPENVGLVGDGQSEPPTIGGALPTTAKRTLIEYTGTGNAIQIRGTFTPFVARRHINIGGFRLLTRSSGRAGISAHFMTRFHIFDIFFDGIPQYQLEMLSCYNGTVERCYFKGGTLYNLYFDVNPSDSVFSGQTLFSKCDFWAGDTGTYIGQFSNIMAQITFDTCHWQSNRIGLHHAGGRPPVLINPHFENNTDYDVYSNGTNNPIIEGGYCNSPGNTGTSIYYGGRDGSIKGMGFNEKASGNYIYLVGNQNTVENCNFRNPTGSTVVDIRVGGNNNTIRPNTYINNTSGARTCVNIEATANRTAVERQNFDASITSGFIVDSGVGTIFDGLIRFTTKTMALGGSADRNPFPATGYNGYIKSVKVIYPIGTTAGTGCQLQLGRSTAPNSVDATKYLNVTSAVSQGTYTSADLTGSLASDKFVASTDILTFNITGGATSTGNVMAVIELTPYRIN